MIKASNECSIRIFGALQWPSLEAKCHEDVTESCVCVYIIQLSYAACK